MIALSTLKYLSTQKFRDAEALLTNNRLNGAVYMMGYALEFSLKRKLSLTLGFSNGFPETNPEMQHYYASQIASFNNISTGITLSQISQIRNHRLTDLVKFSGAEARIVANYFSDWLIVCTWNPEKRYIRQTWTKKKTHMFMNAARRILREIN